MTDHSDSTGITGAPRTDRTTVDEILGIIAAEEPRGVTADQVARAIGLGFDGTVVQDTLEELVEQGVLNRLGIGHGAVYTLSAGV